MIVLIFIHIFVYFLLQKNVVYFFLKKKRQRKTSLKSVQIMRSVKIIKEIYFAMVISLVL